MQLRFILDSAQLGKLELTDQPKGWDDVKKTLTRNPTYIGVFRKYTAELSFVGDGLLYLNALFNAAGSEGQFTTTILRKKDYEDQWVTDFQGIGKLNPFDIQFEGTSASVAIQLEDSGFHTKFENFSKTEIDTGRTISLGGVDMGPFETKTIQLHQRVITEKNKFVVSENKNHHFIPDPGVIANSIKSLHGHVLPFLFTEGETDNVSTPISYAVDSPGMVYDFIGFPATVKLAYEVSFNDIEVVGGASTEGGKFVLRKFTDPNDLNTFTDTILFTSPSGNGVKSFSGTLELTMEANTAFTILLDMNISTPTVFLYQVEYSKCDLTVDVILFFDEYQSQCHYRYEYMKRLVQLITDQQDCFKSDVFGRTDIGYPVNGKFYNNVVMSGLQIRDFPNRHPVTSFAKAFKSVRSIFNVGCGIEKINNAFKVVIEELPYFFRGDVAVTLHSCSDIKVSRVAKDFTFSEVKYGYEKSEYEEVNGLEEYNNKCTATTSIKSVSNSLNLVSDERADGYGIEFARRLRATVAATEDSKYDDDVFTVMVKEEGGILKPKKTEDYSDVQNIAAPESAYNLDITPQRNLLRNGDWISGCVGAYGEDYVRHCSEDKKTDLISTRTGETAVAEQADFQNKTLMSSLWLNQIQSFKCAINPADLDKIEAKPYSLVKWSPFTRERTKKYFYGWVLNIDGGGDDRIGTVQLLAANLNSDRLHLIDPEGIHQGEEGSDLPPQEGEEFGFEYVLESLMEG